MMEELGGSEAKIQFARLRNRLVKRCSGVALGFIAEYGEKLAAL